MAIRIDSPEFATAWRTVSEALLAYIQQGNLSHNGTDEPEGGSGVHPTGNTGGNEGGGGTLPLPPLPTPPVKSRQIIATMYVVCPIPRSDGSYGFKNLKQEKQDESTYKIIKYSDGTCEFELCNLVGEARQIFKDNREKRMPSAVGIIVNGEITADNSIVCVKRGKGIVEGKQVRVTEPLEVEFK